MFVSPGFPCNGKRHHKKHNDQYADIECRNPDFVSEDLILNDTMYHKVDVFGSG